MQQQRILLAIALAIFTRPQLLLVENLSHAKIHRYSSSEDQIELEEENETD